MKRAIQLSEKSIFTGYTNKGNTFAANFALLLFLSCTFCLVISICNEFNLTDLIIKISFLVILLIFLIFVIRSQFLEPAFFKIEDEQFIFRSPFYFLKRRIPILDLKEIKPSNKIFFIHNYSVKMKYDTLILFFKNGTKIILVEYYFENFNEIKYKVKQIQKKNSILK